MVSSGDFSGVYRRDILVWIGKGSDVAPRDEAFLIAVNIAKLAKRATADTEGHSTAAEMWRLTPENTGEPVAAPTDTKG
jgi:hypothetical protein